MSILRLFVSSFISCASAVNFSSLLATNATFILSFANLMAIALPIPLLAPVTIAVLVTRSHSFYIFMVSQSCHLHLVLQAALVFLHQPVPLLDQDPLLVV